MLAKKYRLPIQEFIGKNGRTVKTPFFLLKIFLSRFSYSRFGIIISKKVLLKSTARNKLKRLFFNACNPKENPNKDFLIIVNPKIKELSKDIIIKEIKKILE